MDAIPPDSFGLYLRDLRREPLISRERERELGRRIRAGDPEAVHELVLANLRFVVRLAKGYVKEGTPLEDLVGEGNLGLYEAARRFDERRGVRFITYAVWWIRRNLARALEREEHLVRFPRGRKPAMREIVLAEEALARSLEREPRRDEVARELGTTRSRLDRSFQALRAWSMVTDRDDPSRDAPRALERAAVSRDGSPLRHAEKLQRDEDVRTAVSRLRSRERRVIDLYFGLDGERRHTLVEIAREFELSKERIRQLKERALKRLQGRRLREHSSAAP